jgi:integrase
MLTLYRRHKKECVVHKTGLSPRAKRRYVDCACPIWIYGHTDTESFPRRSTGFTDWALAEAARQSLLKKNQDQVVHGPRIDDCIERFIDGRTHELVDKSAAMYRFQLERLRVFCASRGVHHMKDLTVDLLEDFKVRGLPEKMSDTTKMSVVAKLRCFLRVAFRRGWTQSPLAEAVTAHNAVYEQKEPYSEKEIELIFAEAEKLNGGSGREYANAPKTFCLLLKLMLETGMRVSDAIRFDPAACESGDAGLCIYTYTQRKRRKNRAAATVEAYLSMQLKTEIDTCQWLSPSKPFWYGPLGAGYDLAKNVYDRMQTIGAHCGVNDCRPHRLRDTFAVRALLSGVGIGDVSRLLGHSSVKITEAYYAKWVPARRRRLESIVAQSLMNANHNALGNG